MHLPGLGQEILCPQRLCLGPVPRPHPGPGHPNPAAAGRRQIWECSEGTRGDKTPADGRAAGGGWPLDTLATRLGPGRRRHCFPGPR